MSNRQERRVWKPADKLRGAGFDRIILVATSPAAVSACQKALHSCTDDHPCPVELMTWQDIG